MKLVKISIAYLLLVLLFFLIPVSRKVGIALAVVVMVIVYRIAAIVLGITSKSQITEMVRSFINSGLETVK